MLKNVFGSNWFGHAGCREIAVLCTVIIRLDMPYNICKSMFFTNKMAVVTVRDPFQNKVTFSVFLFLFFFPYFSPSPYAPHNINRPSSESDQLESHT